MKAALLFFALLALTSAQAGAQTYCSQIGDRITCTDHTPAPEEIESKNGEDVWFENHWAKRDHEEAQKKRIEEGIKALQKKQEDKRRAEEEQKKHEKDLARMLGKDKPVKVDADGFYE